MAIISKDNGDHPFAENIKFHWDVFKLLCMSSVEVIHTFRCDTRDLCTLLNGQKVTWRVDDAPDVLDPLCQFRAVGFFLLYKPVIEGFLGPGGMQNGKKLQFGSV